MRLSGYDHATGEHCGSTSLANLADYYGWGFDEPTCFGLASGLGFTFFAGEEPPERYFFGRPLHLEAAFFDHLGIDYTHTQGADWETTWTAMKAALDAGDPVLVFADIYHLDYYDTDTHFAPHSFLLVGYDEAVPGREVAGADPDAGQGVVYCADSESEAVQRLPLSSLRSAMSSEATIPLSNRYLVVGGAPAVERPDAARAAIRETATYMLDPEESRFPVPGWGAHGLQGIRALSQDVTEWTALSDPHWTARFAYQNIERRGTGGACFRDLYVGFLDEVEREVGLSGFADEIHEVGEAWHRVGSLLEEASETPEVFDLPGYLSKTSRLLSSLADREQRFYEEALGVLDGQ
jgi:hypothetical protein